MPEGGIAELLEERRRAGRWPTRQASHPKLSGAGQIRLERKSEKSVCSLLQFRLLEKHEPNIRRANLRHFCERHRGTVEDQRHQRQSLHHHLLQQTERSALQLSARSPAASGYS